MKDAAAAALFLLYNKYQYGTSNQIITFATVYDEKRLGLL